MPQEMKSELLKELREWGTFGVTILTPVVVWIFHTEIKNQRLEINAEIATSYVSHKEYEGEIRKLEGNDSDLARKWGETNGKLDTIGITAATTLQTVSDLKEDVRSIQNHLNRPQQRNQP
jgi:hypothetical protein